jgi:hypothetical protein
MLSFNNLQQEGQNYKRYKGPALSGQRRLVEGTQPQASMKVTIKHLLISS